MFEIVCIKIRFVFENRQAFFPSFLSKKKKKAIVLEQKQQTREQQTPYYMEKIYSQKEEKPYMEKIYSLWDPDNGLDYEGPVCLDLGF